MATVKTVRAIAPSKTQAAQAATVTAAPTLPTVPPNSFPFTTFHVAQKFGVTPFQLRRVLRSMEIYADGKHTAYRWQSLDDADPIMQLIAAKMTATQAKQAAAYAAAQAALQKARDAEQARLDADRIVREAAAKAKAKSSK